MQLSVIIIILLFVGFMYVVTYHPELMHRIDETKDPQLVTLKYFNNGEKSVSITLTKGINEYYAAKSRKSFCIIGCDVAKTEMAYITDKKQLPGLQQVVAAIKNQSQDPQEQARIAISLVQRIPYDEASYQKKVVPNKYPYEVLYDQVALCGEKSRLLTYLLKELGFGTALFLFDEHQAVGILCDGVSFRQSGYCFIETTGPAIITDSQAVYPNVGQLGEPTIIPIADGMKFNALRDYTDNLELNRLELTAKQGSMSTDDYKMLIALTKQYGLDKTSCPEHAVLCNGRCVGECAKGQLTCNEYGPTCQN